MRRILHDKRSLLLGHHNTFNVRAYRDSCTHYMVVAFGLIGLVRNGISSLRYRNPIVVMERSNAHRGINRHSQRPEIEVVAHFGRA